MTVEESVESMLIITNFAPKISNALIKVYADAESYKIKGHNKQCRCALYISYVDQF